MRKTGAALTLALLVTAAAGTILVNPGKANPFDLPVNTGIRIYSPNYAPYQNRQSENGTVTINIAVILVYGEYGQSFTDAHLDSVCYSLNGQPLVYVYNFAIENITDYGRDSQDFFRCSTSVRLENLSDGNHTVTAYANDTHSPTAYINSQSASYNFTVNSHYQVPVVKILSPISQTYSDAAPLIFTVNGEVEEAHCYMYRGESPYEAVYERSFAGNTSLHNLPDGKYVMYLYVTTENGQASASTSFKMANSVLSYSPPSIPNQKTEPPSSQPTETTANETPQTLQLGAIIGTVTAIVLVVGVLLLARRRRRKEAQQT